MTHSARRLNKISELLGAKKYLEVGVEFGLTFFNVDIPNKVAVDPAFRFDINNMNMTGCEFHQVYSDEFFLNKSNSKFDLIFLDGLHQFEQTIRDLLNCLTLSHSKTVIIIDDVMPTDVFSSLRDHSEANKFRVLNGGNGSAWAGDVFKVIYFLHDFMPRYSYATFDDGWNRQTLLWQKPRAKFKPVFDNFELISRMNYFDLINNIDVMKLMDEDTAIGLMINDLLDQ